MKKYILALTCLLCFSCAEAQINLTKVRAIIAQKNLLYTKAFLSRDSAAFVNLHCSKTINMPPDEPFLYGKAAIGANVNPPDSEVKDMVLHIIAVYGGPKYVIEEGKYELKTTTQTHHGKYIVIWKQEAGDWKIYRAIWNLDEKWQ